MTREINKKGLELIQQYEGCQLQAYICPAGILTIGYGHTGPDVTRGQIITSSQADDLLRRDLLKFCQGVADKVKVTVSDNQFAALVCFAFNLGLGSLGGSTLLKLVNRGDFPGASMEFMKWNRSNGKELPGLTRRRNAERELFNA